MSHINTAYKLGAAQANAAFNAEMEKLSLEASPPPQIGARPTIPPPAPRPPVKREAPRAPIPGPAPGKGPGTAPAPRVPAVLPQ